MPSFLTCFRPSPHIQACTGAGAGQAHKGFWHSSSSTDERHLCSSGSHLAISPHSLPSLASPSTLPQGRGLGDRTRAAWRSGGGDEQHSSKFATHPPSLFMCLSCIPFPHPPQGWGLGERTRALRRSCGSTDHRYSRSPDSHLAISHRIFISLASRSTLPQGWGLGECTRALRRRRRRSVRRSGESLPQHLGPCSGGGSFRPASRVLSVQGDGPAGVAWG